MRFLRLAVSALVLSALGCTPVIPDYGPASECQVDSGTCSVGSAGGVMPDGGTTSTGTGGTGGAQGASELTGDVERINTPTFDATSGTPVTGAANIVIQPSSGSPITAAYGGTNPPSFDLMNVPAGPAWVYVQDQSGGASSIWSTISPLSVPQLTPVALPVVDQLFFTNLASNLPSVQLKGLSAQASHVVLLLQHQGAAYKGVQVTGGSAGAVVVYDIGPGTYSDQATATGTGGTIILFDAGVTGLTTLTITDPTLMKNYSVPVLTGTGAVTVAGFDLE